MRLMIAAIFVALSSVPASAMTLFNMSARVGDLSRLIDTLMLPDYAIWVTALAGLLITGSAMRRRRRMPQATD